MRTEVDCVAITDHNSGEWIDILKQAYAELQEDTHPEFRELSIFPGVEVSVNGGVHILAILPENKKTSDVSRLLGGVGFHGEYGNCETCTEKSASEVIHEIIKAGGIAIPAHVDDSKGIFKELKGPTLDQILDIDTITAMEIIEKSYSKPEQYKSKKLNWSEILGSDSHHPTNSSETSVDKFPGSHFTWIKMSSPTIEGLGLALMDGNELSIIRSDESKGNPNAFEHLTIESIEVKDAYYLGNGKAFECKFSPWLNTIIGGRGIGKSTILEFIRLCLQRNNPLPDQIKKDLEKYFNTRENRDDGLIRDNTNITLFLRKDRIRYKIYWDMNHPEGQIFEESEPGKWIETDGDIKQRFPVSIFSQKQIYELSKDQMALLRIIDESPEVNFKEWANDKGKLETRYLSICSQIREKESEINEESALKGELDDVNNRIKILEDSGHTDILNQYSIALEKKKKVEEWENSWKISKDLLSQTIDHINIKEVDSALFEGEPEFLDLLKNTNANILEIKENLNAITENIEITIQEWETNYKKSKLCNNVSTAIALYNSLIQELEDQGNTDLNQYDTLVYKRERIQGKLTAIELASKEKEELSVKAANCLESIDKHRKKISMKREEFLEKVLDSNKHISIELNHYGYLNGIESSIRKIIEKEKEFSTDIAELIKIIEENQDNLEGLIEVKKRICDIYNGNKTNVRYKKFGEHISNLEPEKIDHFMCYFPEDTLDVKYCDQRNKRYVPIKQGSPGQKTAAMLAFLMNYGEYPLILDQPEDDLDNRLIYDLIVSQIKDAKKYRQVIIVTHNANIVVNGDSENVIPLIVGYKNTQTQVMGQGGLQEKRIRKEICDVLEGGTDAFDLRYKRINV